MKNIIVRFEVIEIETTLEILENSNMDFDDDGDGNYEVYLEDGRLEQVVVLDPKGFFTESILYRFEGLGYYIDIESNYKLPPEDQKKVMLYDDSEHYPYLSSWRLYFDKNEQLTFDKDLINEIEKKIKLLYEDGDIGTYSPNGLSIQKLDTLNIIQKLDYYWD
jgi:hypothetical protein